MTHLSGAPRAGYLMIHHTGIANAHQDTTTNFCVDGYDFFVRYGGAIVTCARWADAQGGHASGCNCKTEGIMMNGCFGGCASGNISGPSAAQECSVAWLMAHLNTPFDEPRFRPHRACATWNPCSDPSPTITVCCGSNLTSDTGSYKWNAAGLDFRTRIWSKASNWKAWGCCQGKVC